MMRLGYLAVLITALPLATATEAREMELHECIAAGLESSARIERSEAAVRQSQAELDEARASRYGTFDLTGGYSHVTETMSLTLAIPGLPISRKIRFGDGNSYDFAAVVKAPVYTGGTLTARMESTEAGLKAVRSELASDSLAALFEIRSAYFTALAAREKSNVANLAFTRLERRIVEIDAAIRLGAATEETMAAALGRLEQARYAVELARGDLEAAQLQLGRITGSPGEPVMPVGSLDASLLPVPVWEVDFTPSQIADRPDIQSLGLKVAQSKAGARALGGAMNPSLYFTAGYHYSRPGIDQAANDWMGYGVAGLTASWTLFDAGLRRSRIEKAQGATRILESRRRELGDLAITAVAVARSRLDAAMRAESVARTRYAHEAQKQELVEKRAAIGAGTEAELLDALDDLKIADMELVLAILRVRLAETELLFATGERYNHL